LLTAAVRTGVHKPTLAVMLIAQLADARRDQQEPSDIESLIRHTR